MPDGFLQSMLEDPWFRSELERTFEDRISKEIERRFSELKPVVTEEARQTGYQEGFQKGHTKGETESRQMAEAEFQALKQSFQEEQTATIRRLSSLCEKVTEEKAQILRQHEKLWCEALAKLLDRFQVKGAVDLTAGISQWLHEALAEFSQNAVVTLYLSPSEFEQVKGVELQEKIHFQFEKDLTLLPGEMRADCGDGGLFFSRSKEFQKLEDWLTLFFGKAGQ